MRHKDQNSIYSIYLAESTLGKDYILPVKSWRTRGGGGPTAFWDFYMLEALQAKISTMQANPARSSLNQRIEKASNMIDIALEQCVTQLADRMQGYLIATSIDELAHLPTESDSGQILSGDMEHVYGGSRGDLDEFHRRLVVHHENMKQSVANQAGRGGKISMAFSDYQALQDKHDGKDISTRSGLTLARMDTLMATYDIEELYDLAKFFEYYEKQNSRDNDPDSGSVARECSR